MSFISHLRRRLFGPPPAERILTTLADVLHMSGYNLATHCQMPLWRFHRIISKLEHEGKVKSFYGPPIRSGRYRSRYYHLHGRNPK
jgi:hypothetical protein